MTSRNTAVYRYRGILETVYNCRAFSNTAYPYLETLMNWHLVRSPMRVLSLALLAPIKFRKWPFELRKFGITPWALHYAYTKGGASRDASTRPC